MAFFFPRCRAPSWNLALLRAAWLEQWHWGSLQSYQLRCDLPVDFPALFLLNPITGRSSCEQCVCPLRTMPRVSGWLSRKPSLQWILGSTRTPGWEGRLGLLCYLLPRKEARSANATYWVPLADGFCLARLGSIPIATENDLSSEELL